MAVEVTLREAEVLRVGPDEVLVIKLDDSWEVDMFEALQECLSYVGLRDRAVLIMGEGVELAVAKQPPSDTWPLKDAPSPSL